MRIIDNIFRQEWRIGILDKTDQFNPISDIWSIKYVKSPYKDRWFADPFILDVTDTEIIILVEMVVYSNPVGKIAKLIIDKNTLELKKLSVILDLPTHLSFPAIIRYNGKIYIYPENSASGKLTMYLYDYDTECLHKYTELSDLPLTDAIITTLFGDSYMFATMLPDPNGNTVSVYKASEGIFSEYYKIQELTCQDKTARGAGDIFEFNGVIYRPAQLNNVYYGGGMVFQELSFNNGHFSIKEVSRKKLPRGYNGMHTFNQYKGVTVIDCRRCVHPLLYVIAKRIKNIIKGKAC